MAQRRLPPGVTRRQNPDGSTSYEIRWRQGGGRSGRRLSHTFDRQQAAIDALARIRASGNVCHCARHAPPGTEPTKHYGAPPAAGPPSGPPLQTLGEYATAHIDALTGVGPGYRARFHREIARHFVPFLEQPLDAITDHAVKKWIRGLEEGSHPWTVRRVPGTRNEYVPRPLSPTTIRRLLVQAGSIMAAAQAEGLAARNAFRGHRVGRRDRDRRKDMRLLTHEEWSVLQAALPAGTWRDLCTVLVGTGLRWGEVTALTVGAVDPLSTPPRLHVAQAWQDDGEGGFRLGTPKSVESRRTVTFTGAVLDALIPHLSGKRDEELVFTTPTGRPVRHSNFYHRVWRPALSRAAALVWAQPLVKSPRIHDLRHTHVGWLIAAGRPAAAIQARLGHDSYQTTMNIYGWLMPQVDLDDLAALDAAMPTGARG